MTSIFTEHFWRHVWSAWSIPYKKDWVLPDGREGVKWFQHRTCRVCGQVEVRELPTYETTR